jgi:hypothetical protein
MIVEPMRLHVERRRKIEDVWIGTLQKMRKAILGNHESAANVDLMHEVVFLHRLLNSSHQIYGRSIVDKDVNTSKSFNNFLYAFLNTLFTTNIARDSQGLSSCVLYISSCSIDGSLMLAAVPGSEGCGVTVLARIATLAPSFAHRIPMARPIPLEPPVITTVFPLSGLSLLLICSLMKLSLCMPIYLRMM